MKVVLLLIIIILSLSCNTKEASLPVDNKNVTKELTVRGNQGVVKKDSTKKGVEIFLYSYSQDDSIIHVLDEPEVDRLYLKDSVLAKQLFIKAIKDYDLEFYQEALLCCYLYALSEKEYLEKLNDKGINEEQYHLIEGYLEGFNLSWER